jgi:hypothetical protein
MADRFVAMAVNVPSARMFRCEIQTGARADSEAAIRQMELALLLDGQLRPE